jgi:hypothetical protein
MGREAVPFKAALITARASVSGTKRGLCALRGLTALSTMDVLARGWPGSTRNEEAFIDDGEKDPTKLHGN